MQFWTAILLCLGVSRSGLTQSFSPCGYPVTSVQLPGFPSCCSNYGNGAAPHRVLDPFVGGCNTGPFRNLGACGFPLLRQFAKSPISVVPYSSCQKNCDVFLRSRCPLLNEYSVPGPVTDLLCPRARCQSCCSAAISISQPLNSCSTSPAISPVSPCYSGSTIQPISSCCCIPAVQPVSPYCSDPFFQSFGSCFPRSIIDPTSSSCSGSCIKPIYSPVTSSTTKLNCKMGGRSGREQRKQDAGDRQKNAPLSNLGFSYNCFDNTDPWNTGCCNLLPSFVHDPVYDDLSSCGYRIPTCQYSLTESPRSEQVSPLAIRISPKDSSVSKTGCNGSREKPYNSIYYSSDAQQAKSTTGKSAQSLSSSSRGIRKRCPMVYTGYPDQSDISGDSANYF